MEVLATLLLLLACSLHATAQGPRVTVSRDRDETHFQGQEFRRLCSISPASSTAMIQWLRDGAVVFEERGENLQLHLTSLNSQHQGVYSCRVVISDGAVLGPIDAGRLTVLDRSPIQAPTSQYVIYGSTAPLACSYPGAFPTWRRNGSISSGVISNADVSHEGLYSCDLYVQSSSASIVIEVTVHVIVPVTVTRRPNSFEIISGNVEAVFDVDFTGRREQNMTITWYRNGSRLPRELQASIQTSYTAISGTTRLRFPRITRADQGVYRVELVSHIGQGVLEETITTAETSFQVDVIVRPSPPSSLRFERTTSVSANVMWSLTNQTADEGGEVQVLRVMYSNNTLATELIRLPGNQEQFELTDLIPGTEYTVRLSVVNEDGTAHTNTYPFTTLNGAPKVNSVLIERINETFFIATASLAYSGGGVIDHFEVSYRPLATITWRDLPSVAVSGSGLVWSGIFQVPEAHSLGALDVDVVVVNQFGFKSPSTIAMVERHVPTSATTGSNSNESPGEPLPLWLIVVIATSIISVLVTVLVMICVIFTVYQCRKSRRSKHQYQVNNPNLNNSMERELDADNSMVVRQNTRDRNEMISSRAHSVSTSSLTKKSMTPVSESSSDEKYFKTHRRSPSEASSIIAKHTPSTTASSSPSNMKALYKNQLQNEISLQDLPENIHELQRQSEVAESQCSQTESETVQINNHHNLELSYRMQASLPSSVQSSHQSIPNAASHHSGVSQPSLASSSVALGSGYHQLHASSQRMTMRPTNGQTDVGIITMPSGTRTETAGNNYIMV